MFLGFSPQYLNIINTVINFYYINIYKFICFYLIVDLPIFNKYMDNEALSENVPVGQSVYKLEGINSFGNDNDLIYGIEETDHFEVDSITGVVTIVKPLDHEVDY